MKELMKPVIGAVVGAVLGWGANSLTHALTLTGRVAAIEAGQARIELQLQQITLMMSRQRREDPADTGSGRP